MRVAIGNMRKTVHLKAPSLPRCNHRSNANIERGLLVLLYLWEQMVYNMCANVMVDVVEYPVIMIAGGKTTSHVRPGASSVPRYLADGERAEKAVQTVN